VEEPSRVPRAAARSSAQIGATPRVDEGVRSLSRLSNRCVPGFDQRAESTSRDQPNLSGGRASRDGTAPVDAQWRTGRRSECMSLGPLLSRADAGQAESVRSISLVERGLSIHPRCAGRGQSERPATRARERAPDTAHSRDPGGVLEAPFPATSAARGREHVLVGDLRRRLVGMAATNRRTPRPHRSQGRRCSAADAEVPFGAGSDGDVAVVLARHSVCGR
jgi:hypothetical protein